MNAEDYRRIPAPDALVDGPVDGALLPLVCINGKLYVVPNALHFYGPAITQRLAKKESDGGDNAGKNNNRE